MNSHQVNRIKELNSKLIIENNVVEHMKMKDMLNITRMLNEEDDIEPKTNLKTAYDQKQEEDKFLNYVNDLNINIRFIELEIYDDFVFWGGTVDGIIQFIFKVTPNERTSGIEFNYLEDFSPDNPENKEIIDKIESYYDTFYSYWSNNILQN